MVCLTLRILAVAASALVASGAGASDLEVIYTTRAGDTLIGLERQFLAAPFGWKGLKLHNRLVDPMRIPVGAPLRIPESWLRIEPRTARVVALQGSVTVDGRALALDAQVPAGALLRTDAGAFVTLLMPDESRLTVQPQSSARLQKVNGVRGFGGQNTEVFLERGRVETTVAAQRGPAARYQIRTPTASVAVRGTEFRVGADDAGVAAQAEVTGGEVRFSPSGPGGGAAKALPAGFGLVAKAGQPVPAPRALLPAPSLAGLPTRFERIEVRLPFAAVDKAVGYRAQVARDNRFADVVTDGVFQAPLARFVDLPDGRYWLHVRAIDEAGLEGFDAVHSFEVRARPLPPEPTVAVAGQMHWQAAAEASRYRVQVASEGRFEAPLFDQDVDARSVDPQLAPGRYQWRVASVRASGERGPWSDSQPLVVRQPPGPISLSEFNQRLRFAWPQSHGQIYDVQLARDPAFTDLLVEQRIGEAALTIPAPPRGTYYLRVRDTEPDGSASAWSAVQTLRNFFVLPWWSLSAAAAPNP